jgi:hypothetical protein
VGLYTVAKLYAGLEFAMFEAHESQYLVILNCGRPGYVVVESYVMG